ncbi:MAG: DUF853 family protein [Deltaproteobacteria bacterium]|nr:MAG: DUF853 family protein [Deltaproteobacteria bacterium]
MIRQLARLAFVTAHAALVLMVDQVELAGFETSSIASFRRAIDTLNSIVSEVPSAIAVVACLSDLYHKARSELTKSAIDRLENDPPLEKLSLNRDYSEIEALVGRRLSWLFAEAGAVYHPETPVYPIPEVQLRRFAGHRTRTVLEWCHQFQAQCAAAGQIVDIDVPPVDEGLPGNVALDLDRIAAAWNDARHAPNTEVPDDEEEILAVVGAAAKACADENGLTLVTPPRKNGVLRVTLGGTTETTELAIAVTNRGYQRGAFGTQIDALRRTAGSAVPVAVRTLEFPRGEVCDNVVAKLLKAGGRRAYVDASTLRTLVAFQRFRPAFPEARVAAWRRRDRPISTLAPVAHIFDLERLRPAPAAEAVTAASSELPATVAGIAREPAGHVATAMRSSSDGGAAPAASRRPRATPANGASTVAEAAQATRRASSAPTPPRPASASGPDVVAATAGRGAVASEAARSLRVGTSAGFRADDRTIELDSLLRHTGILGSPGSGKTTLALNLIEQVLERDVAVVLVDRKGDLAGYARPDWWQATSDPVRARKLAERIDVRLFTPGTRGGRPLSLSVVPDLAQIPEHERDRMVQYAANALGAMMRLGETANGSARRAILTQAISLLAGRRGRGELIDLISMLVDRDDELIDRAGRYDDRLFKRLVQDLERR